jgi:hypothetical protein
LLETRHVRDAFKAMPVKSDRNDARGIAQLMRLGWFRPVHCKSIGAQEVRAELTARKLIMQLLVVDDVFWVNAYVDEAYPAAWQRADIYKRLKQIAAGNPAVGNKLNLVVRVQIGRRHIIVLPDRDVDAGILSADEELAVTARNGVVEVRKVKRNRPAQSADTAPAFSI